MNAPETEPTLTPLLTVDQAAAYLQCHRETILRMIRRGDIAATKVGRNYRVNVDEFKPTRRKKPVKAEPEKLRLNRYVKREMQRRQPSVIPYGIRGNEHVSDS